MSTGFPRFELRAICRLAVISLFVIACSQPDYQAVPASKLPDLAVAHAAQQYDLVPSESKVVVRVYRAGSLARLGHNHVLSSTDLRGEVFLAEPINESSLEVRLPLLTLDVDLPAQRAAAGADFPGVVDVDDIAGTRNNMLGAKQLDAERWPQIVLRSRRISGNLPELILHADLLVKSGVYPIQVPVYIEQSSGRILARGSFSVKQTALGLEPFSVMMGALRVRDQLDIAFTLVARPAVP